MGKGETEPVYTSVFVRMTQTFTPYPHNRRLSSQRLYAESTYNEVSVEGSNRLTVLPRPNLMNYRARLTVVLSSTVMVALLLFGSVASKGAASADGGSDTADVLKHLKVYTQVLSYISTEYVEEPNIPNV